MITCGLSGFSTVIYLTQCFDPNTVLWGVPRTESQSQIAGPAQLFFEQPVGAHQKEKKKCLMSKKK